MPISETLGALGKGAGFGQSGSPTFGVNPVEVKIESTNSTPNQNSGNFFAKNKNLLIGSLILVVAIGTYLVLKKKKK